MSQTHENPNEVIINPNEIIIKTKPILSPPPSTHRVAIEAYDPENFARRLLTLETELGRDVPITVTIGAEKIQVRRDELALAVEIMNEGKT